MIHLEKLEEIINDSEEEMNKLVHDRSPISSYFTVGNVRFKRAEIESNPLMIGCS